MNSLPENWKAVLVHLFNRYLSMAQDEQVKLTEVVGEKLAQRTINLCAYAMEHLDELSEDKANRWLGFVQGVLTVACVLDVETERNYTRPLFHHIKGISKTHDA